MINIAESIDYGICKKSWVNGLSSYQQENCKCTLTDDGYRIYRTPNVKTKANGGSDSMWGGFCFYPFRMKSNCIEQYHRYSIRFHVKGKSSNSTDYGWANWIGWSGGGLNPGPSDVDTNMRLGSNFNGEKDCYYDFTINDTIYKTCTNGYGGKYTTGESYLSYEGFKFGFSYTDTGEMGTDLYITNFRLIDITNGNTQNEFLKSGIVRTSYINEDKNYSTYKIDSISESIGSWFSEV